jgi:predicted alpha/beta hydrolase family esterase
VVVASRNDPYMAFDCAVALARDWGARMVDAGFAGHINVASGHGPWPEGRDLIQALARDAGGGEIPGHGRDLA